MTNILPTPYKVKSSEGIFTLNANTTIFSSLNKFDDVIQIIYDYVFEISGIELSSVINLTDIGNKVVLLHDDEMTHEAYSYSVEEKGITITASDDVGFFYAFQSIAQIFGVNKKTNTILIPCGYVYDKPRLKYRGFMLDVSRHFFSIDTIKKIIQALSRIKINYLHLHLTDDQGWRIEIKRYPKLTSIGSKRYTSGIEYGGYYSQKDIKEIISYAQKHYITIIPEIDIPGHCSSMLASYPELACTHNTHKVESNWIIKNANLCPNEKTLEFIFNILEEVTEMFPGKYIHIGCDEFNNNFNPDPLEECKVCKKNVLRQGYIDRNNLFSDFLSQVIKYLEKKDKEVIAWDELLESEDISNAVVMSWRSTQGSINSAKEGRYSILSPHEYFYLNYSQTITKNNSRHLPISKILGFDPYIGELSPKENNFILGVQGCLWSEYVSTEKELYDAIFPRILAIAELGWSDKKCVYEDFPVRVDSFKGIFSSSFSE